MGRALPLGPTHEAIHFVLVCILCRSLGMDLYDAAWGHIASFLVPIDIAALSNTRKLHRPHLRRVLSRVILARLAALVPPQLRRRWPPNVKLSGSVCWHVLDGGKDWKPNDRDVFCYPGQLRAAQAWLEQCDLFVQSGGLASDNDYPTKRIQAVFNFYAWPMGCARAPVPVKHARKMSTAGLDMRGREFPLHKEDMLSLKCVVQLIVLKPGTGLNFDLSILLNTYNGEEFVVQRPDLVFARACDMDVPAFCPDETADPGCTVNNMQRDRAVARYTKYTQRGIDINVHTIPHAGCLHRRLCTVEHTKGTKRKANAQ